MKKKFLVVFLLLVMCLSLTGCKDKEEGNTNNPDQQQDQQGTGGSATTSLEGITNDLIKFYQTDKAQDYLNLVSYYIDNENDVVVVELKDNSSEAQDWFLKNIVNSDKIKFIKFEEQN